MIEKIVFGIFINFCKAIPREKPEMRISYNTFEPYCSYIPHLPSGVESTCGTRDYQSGHDYESQCQIVVRHTCTCTINIEHSMLRNLFFDWKIMILIIIYSFVILLIQL